MKLWLTDPKTGKQSVTLSLLVLGFCVATLKLLVSGMNVYGILMESFPGSDYALVLGALGGIYGLRKHQENKKPEADPDEREI